MIKLGELQLVTSYVLRYENSRNSFTTRRTVIEKFLKNYSSYHVGADKAQKIKHLAKPIIASGVKMKDAFHIACALEAGCKYFLSTDERLLKKFRSDEMLLLNPINFIMLERK